MSAEPSAWPMIVAAVGSVLSAMAVLIVSLIKYNYDSEKKARAEKDKAHEDRLLHLERTSAEVERENFRRLDAIKDKNHAMELAAVKMEAKLDSLGGDHDDVVTTMKDMRGEFNTRLVSIEQLLQRSEGAFRRPDYRRAETPAPFPGPKGERDPR